ncbi:glycosyltransferase family 4 protein [Hymenobacter terricola]|uniref:glycosyltransferase family 4 protein n=1 Tax=Hymenobacter terricola TaxID=2819236 RepID=UPI001B30CE89|nr:glycosyltransferase family 4 protein [Hymenobacter terricola]
MNILLVSMMVPEAPSGVRVHYQRLAAGLRALGHTVTVLTPAGASRWQSRPWGALRRLLALAGPAGEHLGGEIHSCANIFSALDRGITYDVVNAQDATTGWLLRQALGRRVPVVVTGHFNDHPGQEVVRQLGLRGWAARTVVRWHNFFLGRAEHFVSVSGYVQLRVAPLLPAQSRHKVVPHGLDLQKFAAVPADAELQARAAGRPVLLNIGHLEGRKNQIFLLAVAEALRALRSDFLLGLVGTGPDEARLRARIAAAGLQDVVWLAGHRAEVAPLLRASTLYVHAATNESFGLVLLEAMACDVPVLAMGVGAVPEVLAHDPEALFAPAATPAAVAERLHRLLASPAARAALRQRQHAHATARFDLPAMLASTVEAYESARRAAAPTTASQAARLSRPSSTSPSAAL